MRFIVPIWVTVAIALTAIIAIDRLEGGSDEEDGPWWFVPIIGALLAVPIALVIWVAAAMLVLSWGWSLGYRM